MNGFKDLTLGLKIAAIGGWIAFIVYSIAIIVGLVSGIAGG